MIRSFGLAAVSAFALLAACTTPGEQQQEVRAFDPAACYTRDFVVYFDDGSINLTNEAREAIGAVGDAIRGCTIGDVRVIGSAEDEGGRVEAQEVSERRAQVLAEYLNEHVGWPRRNFTLLATGERGATTDSGLAVPMRRRARIVVNATAPVTN